MDNMMRIIAFILYITFIVGSRSIEAQRYTPDWESLDSRPLPAWYDEAKVGIFIHWGVFSAPGYSDGESAFLQRYLQNGDKQAMEFMKKNYPPNFTYADFASTFHAEYFDPNHWADVFKAAGAKYIVLTSKHVEGFTNWPSNVSFNWNAMDVGPKRDLVGDLASAIRKNTDIRFGLYHCLLEWSNPLYIQDKASGCKTKKFAQEKAIPELYEIVNSYRPDIVWSDGEWEAPESYWNSTNFVAWLYNDSPVKDAVVTNDRWAAGTICKHGGYFTCTDKYNPGVLQKHKWENCMTIDLYSWGYRRNMLATDVMKIEDLIKTLVETVSCGGNLLMNVGPTGDGRIVPIFEERLRQFGSWMAVNGEAIYASTPWMHQNDTVTPNLWYTSKKTTNDIDVYALVLNWPKSGTLDLGAPVPSPVAKITMLGYSGNIKWIQRPGGGITITMPLIPDSLMPCRWAWTFKLQHLAQ